MRWQPRLEPKGGDRRVRTSFAWCPVVACDGYVYWLETVAVEEVYRVWGGWQAALVRPMRSVRAAE